MARRLIPLLWLRLVVLGGFSGVMYAQGYRWVAVAGAVLMVLTIVQLI